MINVNLDEILTKVDCRYTLVVESAKRARQIVEGSPALTEEMCLNPVTQAVTEIQQEKITYVRNTEGIK